MKIELQVQNASSVAAVPPDEEFSLWVTAALQKHGDAVLTIRLVDSDESQALNSRFRGQDKPTNVLSFPADLPDEIDLPLLGDIVICAPLVESEALEQGKTLQSHWAHLSIHGVFHLLGHDHQSDEEALEMETLESQVMTTLGFPDPYAVTEL
jgi:probable rRNA maturation factor